ncbi:restriction endonuclease subunit S [Pluralibacter gergoviae]|nr:restriction endonuclease subunit S [Pluralibacter gergoviae]ELC3015820.1 restriction endonuclease subunit S [Pluralibacter gergoviae]ELC3020799.1 restriction endonuclease subunit S [Pluralibacter gergoviae]
MSMEKKVPEIRFKGFNGEWDKKKLGEVGDTFTGLSGKTKDDFGHGHGRFVTYLNVFSNAISDENSIEPIEIDTNQNEVKKGDVLFTTSSETPEEVGMSSIWMSEIKNVYLNSFCFGYRPKQKFDNYYLAYMLRSNSFREKIVFLAQGISRYNISKTKVMDIKVSIPNFTEQEKIGNYFQNLDTLINQHQQKHDKLSNIKKAMLEKMFPKRGEFIPEIRFKGFNGEWDKKSLGELGDTFTGLSGKTKDDFGHGQGRFVTYLNVFSNAISDENSIEPIEIDTNQNEVKKGDVLFTTSSETPEEVGMSSIWMSEIKNVYLNSFCFGYRPTQKFDNYYLAYMLRSNSFREKIVFLAQGISRYNISKTKVMDIKVSIPNLNEQEKIGNYFQKLDTLINKHQQQITKLNNIKQACLSKMFV